MQEENVEPSTLEEFCEFSMYFSLVFMISENIKPFITYQLYQEIKYNVFKSMSKRLVDGFLLTNDTLKISSVTVPFLLFASIFL